MIKEEFVAASKNVARYYYGIQLPLSVDTIMEKEGCTFYFYYELPSSYDDDDDNEVDCVFWYSVANYTDVRSEDGIELSMGIDGRSGDHFFLCYKDWLQERKPLQQR